LDLNEAKNLAVGDRVVFKPVPKQDQYSFQSSMVPGHSETLYPGKDYFVSSIEYVDKRENTVARISLFGDILTDDSKQKIYDAYIKLDNVLDLILFDHLQIPKQVSDLTLDEAIIEAENFGEDLLERKLLPDNYLAVINSTNNLGDLPIKDYQDYLKYSVDFYREIDLKTFETYGFEIPDHSMVETEWRLFNKLVAERRKRTNLDLEFVEFMDYIGADTYKEMVLLLEESQVPEKDLLELYEYDVLKKQEWLMPACYGSDKLYVRVLSGGKK